MVGLRLTDPGQGTYAEHSNCHMNLNLKRCEELEKNHRIGGSTSALSRKLAKACTVRQTSPQLPQNGDTRENADGKIHNRGGGRRRHGESCQGQSGGRDRHGGRHAAPALPQGMHAINLCAV